MNEYEEEVVKATLNKMTKDELIGLILEKCYDYDDLLDEFLTL